MRFIKNTLLTFSTQLISVFLGVITSVILARTLGPTNLGIYSLLLTTFSLIGSIGSLGISIANTYYGVKGEYKWNEIASNSIIAALIMGIILIVFFLSLYFLGLSFLNNINFTVILISSIAIPSALSMGYFQNILLGQRKIKQYNAINIVQSILYMSFIVIVLYFNGSLSGVIVSWTAAYLLTAIIPIILVYKSIPFKLHLNLNLFKKSITFGLKGYLGNLIQFLNYRIDMYLINFILLNSASVGYYSISVGLAESLWYLPGAVGTLVFARTPGLTNEERNRTTPQICRNTLFITIIFSIILVITGKYIISILYGSRYLDALTPLLVLIPGVIALSIAKVLSNEIAGRGKPIINTYIAIISIAVNVPLNLILIPKIGIVGSALASSISYTITTIVVLSTFLKLSKSSLNETLILKKQDIEIYKTLLLKVFQISKNLVGRILHKV